ncbi:MAG: DNA polymerase Y family protein [Phycisphaerae bacterium]|nr:DNA polymerase Y family protein [Phycisphaerae bacterium]
MVLIATRRGQCVVARCCARARTAGVREGMSPMHAQALVPGGVAVLDHEPQRDEAALRALGHWALRFSPRVIADPPDGLLLDVAGCERLLGSEEKIAQSILAELSRLGFAARGAVAPTVAGAWALARFAPQALSVVGPGELATALQPLPIAALRLEASTENALVEVAVDRIGDLLRLSRRSIFERFGPAALERIDRALGRTWERIDPLVTESSWEAERKFAGPVRNLMALQQALAGLLEELTSRLKAQQQGAGRFILRIERFDLEAIDQTVCLSRPCRDARHLERLFHPRLERVQLGWGVEALVLQAKDVRLVPHGQVTCWPQSVEAAGAPGRGEAASLVDQLVNRLGGDRVVQAKAVETHVPEQSFQYRPVLDGATGTAEISPLHADRPSCLFSRPRPVSVVAMTPDGPVISLRWQGAVCRVLCSIGPERITPRWWLRHPQRLPASARDYFKVQDEHGRWWWIYRQVEAGGWFVHGQWS